MGRGSAAEEILTGQPRAKTRLNLEQGKGEFLFYDPRFIEAFHQKLHEDFRSRVESKYGDREAYYTSQDPETYQYDSSLFDDKAARIHHYAYQRLAGNILAHLRGKGKRMPQPTKQQMAEGVTQEDHAKIIDLIEEVMRDHIKIVEEAVRELRG